MTATKAQINDPDASETAETLAKVIKKLAKGIFALESVEAIDKSITLSYHLKKQYTFKKLKEQLF